MPVHWPQSIDEVITGDLTVAAAYLTPAGGAVVTGVAPCAMVGFTTSLGFGKKLQRLIEDPHVALAYHTREHGFSTHAGFVLVQGQARLDLAPSRARLTAFQPQAERFVGPVKQGRVWDRLLREYYSERVFVDLDVVRVTAWPDLMAAGTAVAYGAEAPSGAVPEQRPPKNGTGPRVEVDRAAGALASLPHRLLAYRGADGAPVIVPVDVAGHGGRGIGLVAAPGLLPPGGRRAGFLAHSFRPQLVGLASRTFTGWLDVAPDGTAMYAPHTSKGFWAPPRKTLLLLGNGAFAKYGMWKARREGVAQHLAQAQAAVLAGPQGPVIPGAHPAGR